MICIKVAEDVVGCFPAFQYVSFHHPIIFSQHTLKKQPLVRFSASIMCGEFLLFLSFQDFLGLQAGKANGSESFFLDRCSDIGL